MLDRHVIGKDAAVRGGLPRFLLRHINEGRRRLGDRRRFVGAVPPGGSIERGEQVAPEHHRAALFDQQLLDAVVVLVPDQVQAAAGDLKFGALDADRVGGFQLAQLEIEVEPIHLDRDPVVRPLAERGAVVAGLAVHDDAGASGEPAKPRAGALAVDAVGAELPVIGGDRHDHAGRQPHHQFGLRNGQVVRRARHFLPGLAPEVVGWPAQTVVLHVGHRLAGGDLDLAFRRLDPQLLLVGNLGRGRQLDGAILEDPAVRRRATDERQVADKQQHQHGGR